MSARKRRPSLLGGLLWLSLGGLFLLHNLGRGPDIWSLTVRYWPILLILLGLGKVIDYYRQKGGVALRVGEIIGIIFLILIGTAITKTYRGPLGPVFRDWRITVGDSSVRPGEWLGTSYSYTQEATYPLVLVPSEPVQIENAYGLVSISPGSDGEVRVRLKKVVYSSDETKAKGISDEIKLEAGPQSRDDSAPVQKVEAEPRSKGKPAAQVFVVRTNRDALSSKDYRFNTEMEVFVPKKTELVVRNSFGEVRVSGIDGKLNLSTTHNPLELRDCSGEFAVSNRFAESRLINLTGNVDVDARGRVYLESIKGDVKVRDEYSPVEIVSVDGTVSVTNTENNIRIEKVTKPVVIDARGSQVRVSDLDSTLKVTTSHRRLDVTGVASDVTVESEYGTVVLKDLRGNVVINTTSDKINGDGIRGSLTVKGQGSGVRVNSVDGPVDIATTLKDVVVNNFAAGCKVANEYADVSLSTGKLGNAEINVRNHNGGIDLFLPEGAQFQIDATARNGRVDSDYEGLQPTSEAGDVGQLRAKIKGGGPKITLETDYSNIRLHARSTEDEQPPKPEAEPRRSRPQRRSAALH